METRTCKRKSSPTCTAQFEPDFSRQVNCNECKKYDLAQKNKSRANQKAAKTPTHEEWTWRWSEHFPEQHAELRAFERQFEATVSEELGRELSDDEAETLYWASVASYCFKKGVSPWVRVVSGPNGVIVGGAFYPEVLGRGLVKNTHRFDLEKSQRFSKLYRELLNVLDKQFGKNANSSDEWEGGSARDIKLELRGEYVPRAA